MAIVINEHKFQILPPKQATNVNAQKKIISLLTSPSQKIFYLHKIIIQPLDPDDEENDPGSNSTARLDDGCGLIRNALYSTWEGKIFWDFLSTMFR